MINLFNDLITKNDIEELACSEELNFDDEERTSILEKMHSIDVQACPGSGKTTLIAAKLILLAKKWPLSHQGICVLSHTNIAKDEIIERLKNSKTLEAQRLLSYPHFIGTIQEFVGKFMAFPYLRSKKIKIHHVDTDLCVELIYSKISYKTRSYIDSKNTHSNVLYNFDLRYNDGKLSIDVPSFKGTSNSESYKNLQQVRSDLIKEGCFFYKDIFTYAQVALSKNAVVPQGLRKRFPLVFVDEMQDTQKFQDELLCDVFPLTDPEVIIQRFGDPDQAIFHGVGNDESNASFNGKSVEDMDYVVHKSHRFDARLAGKIKPLSHNRIPLETELTEEALAHRSQAHYEAGIFKHSVIIFNDDTRYEVIPRFGNIVSEQFHKEYKKPDKFIVKALGAVGNAIDPAIEQLKIGHYWAEYDKNKAKGSLKEIYLIEIVRYCRQSFASDFRDSYKLLFDSILKFLRLAKNLDENGREYTRASFRDFLERNNKWNDFKKELYFLLSDVQPLEQKYWVRLCDELVSLSDLQDIPDKAAQYLLYVKDTLTDGNQGSSRTEDNNAIISLPENKIVHPDGFNIHLSTIHGVKGETHDATLVMETKNHSYDIGSLINHIAGIDKTEIIQKRKIQFSRQLYVAVSRPRHLLCLSIHEDRIDETQKTALVALGWNIVLLGK